MKISIYITHTQAQSKSWKKPISFCFTKLKNSKYLIIYTSCSLRFRLDGLQNVKCLFYSLLS